MYRDLIDDMNSYILIPDGKVRDKKLAKRIEWILLTIWSINV